MYLLQVAPSLPENHLDPFLDPLDVLCEQERHNNVYLLQYEEPLIEASNVPTIPKLPSKKSQRIAMETPV